jgi:uncharacterized membrane protein
MSSIVNVVPSSHLEKQHHHKPAQTDDEHVGFNGRLGAWITRRVGSMPMVYGTTGFILGWVLLAEIGWLAFDRFPFSFLLFLGNVVQLLLIFVILVGQQVLGGASDKRSLQTYEDAEAILQECQRMQAHLQAQDSLLNSGISLFEHVPHPHVSARKKKGPAKVRDIHIGLNGRIACLITEKCGSMWAFYFAAAFQVGWMLLGMLGVLRFDPYPFAFLLFLSSLTQLILMFVIMVGQQVLGAAADRRAIETFEDAEAVLHECERLQAHLQAQDEIIVRLVRRLEHCAREHASPPAAGAETAGAAGGESA